MADTAPRADHDTPVPAPYGPSAVTVPSSSSRFPDGGAWRVEIPSVEGPDALEAVLETAAELDVPIHRVSQGSGVTMLTDREIDRMRELCAAHRIELCLFARPGADWDIGAGGRPGSPLAARARGLRQLDAVLAEIRRGSDLGVRSFLVSDEGALFAAHRLRQAGALPADLQLKTSVLAGPANPASFHVHELLGADTINVPSDLSLTELADLRARTDTTIDFYVEAPDDGGGFVRLWEIAEIARVAAPVYLKFGLRLAPGIYPSGAHLSTTVLNTARERVRRARLGLDALNRQGGRLPMSATGERTQPTVDRSWPLEREREEVQL